MDRLRMAMFDRLYRRLGELLSHLGRYDMQLIAFAWMLTEDVVLKELIESWTIESRVDVIGRLMQARQCATSLQHRFLDIHQQMKPIIDRQAICASHPAVITQVGFARPGERAAAAPRNDWFNRTENITRQEVDRAVVSVERDILTAVKLYLSLATLASQVQRALLEPSTTAVV
jgi:hypothetical protein